MEHVNRDPKCLWGLGPDWNLPRPWSKGRKEPGQRESVWKMFLHYLSAWARSCHTLPVPQPGRNLSHIAYWYNLFFLLPSQLRKLCTQGSHPAQDPRTDCSCCRIGSQKTLASCCSIGSTLTSSDGRMYAPSPIKLFTQFTSAQSLLEAYLSTGVKTDCKHKSIFYKPPSTQQQSPQDHSVAWWSALPTKGKAPSIVLLAAQGPLAPHL